MIDTKTMGLVSDFPLVRATREPLPIQYLDTESVFYGEYEWCLNAVPTVSEIINHLRREVDRFGSLGQPWHLSEAATNIFLLACAVSDTVDDYLLGSGVDFSRAAKVIPAGRHAGRVADKLRAGVRSWRLKNVEKWRNEWELAVGQFLQWYLRFQQDEGAGRLAPTVGAKLTSLLSTKLPVKLSNRRSRIPAAFRSQDLTHFDVLRLGSKFMEAFPERGRNILVVGLRTAGSYLAPLLRAYLQSNGYENVDFVTLRPKKGIAPWEKLRLARCAASKGLVAIVDEPIGTGGTVAKAVGIVRQAGVAPTNVVALFPIHPTGREWNRSYESLVLSTIRVLTLEPEEWYKQAFLEGEVVKDRLKGYFRGRGYPSVSVVASATAERLNREFQLSSDEGFHTRLKRVYEIELQNNSGERETRYVLAKSVGWGWLSYHAFVLARELAPFVPPVLGLRDGILYTEWLCSSEAPTNVESDRSQFVETAASYVAARVRHMGLGQDPSPDLGRENRHAGFERLTTLLSKAYGWSVAMALKRTRIRQELSARPCPYPTLIDGRMRAGEWIRYRDSFRKADFEHHGMGKHQLSVTDPAYDLADLILHWRLSPDEERKLLARYKAKTGDEGISGRLFLYKVLAGTHSIDRALTGLSSARLLHRHQEFNRLYVEARTFLTMQTMRLSAALVTKPRAIRWGSPLVVLDIDGVLDKQIFGYPSTTASGILAFSLLHSHERPVALNTARAVGQMREYCGAYACVGGVAEYGSYVWDAVAKRERVLVSDESMSQLEHLRQHLRQTPGVFVNDDYQYSIQAYVYEKGVTVPLPGALIRNLMAELKTDRLGFHQTYTDTAVIAKEADKGRGLAALLQLAGKGEIETMAVGDSAPDLPMFRMASRSFAPANISCRTIATLLECRISEKAYQAGLLQIVRSLLHTGGDQCKQCEIGMKVGEDGLFFRLLQVADQSRLKRLVQTFLDPMALAAIVERSRN